MLRPIAPFVEYVINYDYISKVLCINKDKPELSCKGKCHLMQQLAKKKQDDFNSLRIHMEEYPIGFINLLTYTKEESYTSKEENTLFSYNKNYYFLYNKNIFHPPTV